MTAQATSASLTSRSCCGVQANLNELNLDWPMRFARFEIGVMNGTRDQHGLDSAELERAPSPGHHVRQVLAHY